MSEWIWVQERSLLLCPYVWGILSRDACWVTAGFWGAQSPFLLSPPLYLMHFLTDLLMSFQQSHMRWPGFPHPKQFLVFFWYNSTTLVKWVMYSMDWSASYTLLNDSTFSSAEGSDSSSPSCSTPGSSFAMSFLTVTAWAANVQLPFSLHKGNRFPGIWEHITFDPLVAAVLGGRGSMASANLSSFHVARSRLE